MLTMASALVTQETLAALRHLDGPQELSEHFDLSALQLPHGVVLSGVPATAPGAREPPLPRSRALNTAMSAGRGAGSAGGAGRGASGGGALAVAGGSRAAQAEATAHAAARAELQAELQLLQDEKIAAQRDRDYYAARLQQQQQAAAPKAMGGGAGAGGGEVSAAALYDLRSQLAEAQAAAERARVQSTDALREKTLLKAQVGSPCTTLPCAALPCTAPTPCTATPDSTRRDEHMRVPAQVGALADQSAHAQAETEAAAAAEQRVRRIVTQALGGGGNGGSGGDGRLLEELSVQLHRSSRERQVPASPDGFGWLLATLDGF